MGSYRLGFSKSRSKTKESALSAQQAEILERREGVYRQHFQPQLIQAMQDIGRPGADTPALQQATTAVNQAAISAQRQVDKSLAQRGVAGTQSGLSALATTGIQTARQQNLANAAMNASQQGFQRRSSLMQLALGAAPTPTTAAPVLSSSKSRSKQGGGSFLQ